MDIGLEEIVTLRGVYNSLKDGALEAEDMRKQISAKAAVIDQPKTRVSLSDQARADGQERKPVDRTPPEPAPKTEAELEAESKAAAEVEAKAKAKADAKAKAKAEADAAKADAKAKAEAEAEAEAAQADAEAKAKAMAEEKEAAFAAAKAEAEAAQAEAAVKQPTKKNWDSFISAVVKDYEELDDAGGFSALLGFYGDQIKTMRDDNPDAFADLERRIGVDIDL